MNAAKVEQLRIFAARTGVNASTGMRFKNYLLFLKDKVALFEVSVVNSRTNRSKLATVNNNDVVLFDPKTTKDMGIVKLDDIHIITKIQEHEEKLKHHLSSDVFKLEGWAKVGRNYVAAGSLGLVENNIHGKSVRHIDVFDGGVSDYDIFGTQNESKIFLEASKGNYLNRLIAHFKEVEQMVKNEAYGAM